MIQESNVRRNKVLTLKNSTPSLKGVFDPY